jgi:hypothetical protein
MTQVFLPFHEFQGKTSYAELWSGKYVLGDETRRETIVYIR